MNATQPSGHGIGGALRTVASVTMLSRVAGLARDAICSRIFGAGPIWSAFAFAFLLPNLFRRLFGEGALSAAFLPEYARLVDENPAQARAYAGATISRLAIGLIGATLLGELILLALALSPMRHTGALAIRLSMITLPFMPMVCSTAILGAMLQCRHRFAIPAGAPILVNLCMIAAATIWTFGLGASQTASITAVAVAVLVAGVWQLVWSILTLREDRPKAAPTDDSIRPILRRTFRNMTPVAIGMSALQINTLIDGLVASWPILVGSTIRLPFLTGSIAYPLDESSNAILFFGQRLYNFPLGVFGVAIATAVFPALARATRNPAEFIDTIRRGIRLSLFIGIPASVGLIFVREPLVQAIYQGGEFSSEAGDRVANVLLGYAPGIWAFGLTHVFTRAFYAHGDMKTPVRISLASIALNATLNLTLIWWLREAALAWSTTISAVLQCAVLAWLSRRRWGDGLFDRTVVGGVGRTIAVTAGMALTLWLVTMFLPGAGTWSEGLFETGVLVTMGGALFALSARLLRTEELAWILERRRSD